MSKKTPPPSDQDLIISITVSRLDLLKQAVLEYGEQSSINRRPKILDIQIKETQAATVGSQQRATVKIYVNSGSDLFWLGRDYYILLNDEKLREAKS